MLMAVLMSVMMTRFVFVATIFVIMYMIRYSGQLIDGAPYSDGTKDYQHQQRDAAQQHPQEKFRMQHEADRTAPPQHDGHAAQRTAHGNGEQLIEVVGVAIAM